MPVNREILSVPPVGHGNPATALALLEQAWAYPDLQVQHIVLSGTAHAARSFHERMTGDPDRARQYVDEPEKRTTLASKAYAMASAFELAIRAGRSFDGLNTAWTVVQEHSLLGASRGLLRLLDINNVRLTTPDVYPKDSGIQAARKHSPYAAVYVWNAEAQEKLGKEGIRTVLTAPYLDEFRQADCHDGHTVVGKTSGSGLPAAWQIGLFRAFNNLQVGWAFHTPKTRHTVDGTTQKPAGESLNSFYGDIGTDTRLVIGYPSELVGLVAGRNELGFPTWMITYPPRGAHEKSNLEFGLKNGLILGELALGSGPSLDDPRLNRISLKHLPGLVDAIYSYEPLWAKGQGIVGNLPFWEVARSFDI